MLTALCSPSNSAADLVEISRLVFLDLPQTNQCRSPRNPSEVRGLGNRIRPSTSYNVDGRRTFVSPPEPPSSGWWIGTSVGPRSNPMADLLVYRLFGIIIGRDWAVTTRRRCSSFGVFRFFCLILFSLSSLRPESVTLVVSSRL